MLLLGVTPGSFDKEARSHARNAPSPALSRTAISAVALLDTSGAVPAPPASCSAPEMAGLYTRNQIARRLATARLRYKA